MFHRFSIAMSLTLLPLLAQQPDPAPIRAVGDRVAVQHNAGLQAAGAHRLLGGGVAYRATFDAAGMRFEPALGRSVPTTQHLALRAVAVQRGDRAVASLGAATLPQQSDRVAIYEHAPGVSERYDVRPDGVELSWILAQRPAGRGDLVVRYAVDTSLAQVLPRDGGVEFTTGEHGGVRIGDVTGIDADGQRRDGDVRWHDGMLELSLPASFVDTAAYPLVLDPLIGTTFAINATLAYADAAPDAAYDATTDRFLVVWQRTFSATDVAVRGQLVTAGGTLVGGLIFFFSNGIASAPRVANLGVRDRFGVVWSQDASGTSTVQFQTCEAGNAALSNGTIVATSTTSSFASADIGSQCEAPIGLQRGFVVTYEDNDLGDIRARRYWYTAADVLQSAGATTLFSDVVLGSTYTAPAISRTASDDARLLVVCKRRSVLFTNTSIEATVIHAGVGAPITTVTVASSSVDDLAAPDVDGYDGKWVVAWERTASGLVGDAVRVAPVAYDSSTNTLTAGAFTTFGGTLLARASAPSLGYTPGRTWLGYQLISSLPTPTTTLRVAAIDSGSCASCNDTFTVGFPDGPRIVVATMTSGGRTSGEDALAVFHDSFDDIDAQLLRNYGLGGSIVNLGGSCGSSGTQLFSHSPGIGSSGLRNTLSSLPASTLAAIFNFSQPSPTNVCGPCVWVPFSVTLAPPILNGVATVEFAVPCQTALVGAQFETQWTTIDFSQSPCPFFPSLTNSNRLLLTIGQ